MPGISMVCINSGRFDFWINSPQAARSRRFSNYDFCQNNCQVKIREARVWILTAELRRQAPGER
jgi:hypothetical protein